MTAFKAFNIRKETQIYHLARRIYRTYVDHGLIDKHSFEYVLLSKVKLSLIHVMMYITNIYI